MHDEARIGRRWSKSKLRREWRQSPARYDPAFAWHHHIDPVFQLSSHRFSVRWYFIDSSIFLISWPCRKYVLLLLQTSSPANPASHCWILTSDNRKTGFQTRRVVASVFLLFICCSYGHSYFVFFLAGACLYLISNRAKPHYQSGPRICRNMAGALARSACLEAILTPAIELSLDSMVSTCPKPPSNG